VSGHTQAAAASQAGTYGRDPGSDPAYGWVIVAALSATATVSYGVLTYAFTVLLVPMERELGWSRTTISGAFSLALGVAALAGPAVGRLLDRHSPRPLMTAGSAAAALAVLAWSRVSTVAELYLVFAGIGLAMATVLYEPAFTVITKWFVIQRHRALTILTLVGALASFIFSPLTQHLVAVWSWRGATAALAAILAAVTVPLHGLVLRPTPIPAGAAGGEDTARCRDAAAAPAPAGTGVLLRTRSFWLLAASFVLAAFTSTAVTVHLVALLIDAGRPPAFAAFAAGLTGIAQLPGRLLFALVGRKLPGPCLPIAVFGLGALALTLLALDRAPAGVLGFAVLYGMGNGMTTLLRATLPGDLYGRHSYGAVTGVLAGMVNTTRALAPFATAALLPGRSTMVLALLAATSAAAALAGASAARRAPTPPHSAVT